MLHAVSTPSPIAIKCDPPQNFQICRYPPPSPHESVEMVFDFGDVVPAGSTHGLKTLGEDSWGGGGDIFVFQKSKNVFVVQVLLIGWYFNFNLLEFLNVTHIQNKIYKFFEKNNKWIRKFTGGVALNGNARKGDPHINP